MDVGIFPLGLALYTLLFQKLSTMTKDARGQETSSETEKTTYH